MAEVREDLAAEERRAVREARERAAAGGGFGEWLRGLRLGGLTWKPLAGLAAVILIVAAGIGYAVGTGGAPNTHTRELKAGAGIAAKVVREGEKGEIHLAELKQLPEGKVLEAWVEREQVSNRSPPCSSPTTPATPRPRSRT